MMLPDLCTKEVKGKIKTAKIRAYCAQVVSMSLGCHTLRKSFGMYGGDDGARTRDLCRDRAAL
jgi:hypothetical protein